MEDELIDGWTYYKLVSVEELKIILERGMKDSCLINSMVIMVFSQIVISSIYQEER